MVFAGDELGLEGDWGEDARRTMPWDATRALGRRRCSTAYRRLIALRRSSDALARGGIRYAHVGADAIAYLRETRGERLLCLAARAAHDADPSPARRWLLRARDARTAATRRGDGVAVLPADGPAFHVWRIRSDG